MREYADIRYGSASEGAAFGLLAIMTGISEECWCAGWMNRLEYDLWNISVGTQYGQGIITERHATLLRLLSEECDGWWMWGLPWGGGSEPTFIRTDQWEKIFNAA